MSGKFYFGKNRNDSKQYQEYDLLKKLKPGDPFILKYSIYENKSGRKIDEYSLMKRTKCRKWDQFLGKHIYTDEEIHINFCSLFYQNFFGLDSNRVFPSIEDSELNLLTNIHFGKDAKELPMMI